MRVYNKNGRISLLKRRLGGSLNVVQQRIGHAEPSTRAIDGDAVCSEAKQIKVAPKVKTIFWLQ
jgi:hypothetical protein